MAVESVQETREAIERRTAEHRTRHDALGAEYAGLGGAEAEAQQRGDVGRVLAVRQRGAELEHEIPLAKAAEVEALADLEEFDARKYVDDPAAQARVTRLRAEREQLDAEIRDEQATIDGRRRRRADHLMSETEYRHKVKLIQRSHE
jgi:hypothetical protein